MVEAIVFALMAAGTLAGAITVVVARNPVMAVMGLLGTLFSVAVLFVLQLAQLVAAVQVIVYAGAVMTLFLFVIMLIGVDKEESREETLPGQRLMVGLVAGAVILLAVGVTLLGDFRWVPGGEATPSLPPVNGTVQAVAEPLFTDWVLAFEATALLLTIAAAGAIVLAQQRRRP